MSTHLNTDPAGNGIDRIDIIVEEGSTPETWLVSVARVTFDGDFDRSEFASIDRQPTMAKAVESAYTVRRAFEWAGHDVTLKSPKGYHRPA